MLQKAYGDLEAANAQLQAVFDVVNVGMLLVDEQGVVKRVNNTVSRWVGRDLSAVNGAQPGDLLGLRPRNGRFPGLWADALLSRLPHPQRPSSRC